MRRTHRPLFAAAVFLLLCSALSPPAAGASEERLARAERLLDEDRPTAALQELEPVLRRDPDHARALLLRSSARFMEGLMEEGRADLERALEADPTLRQAWLNRAGVDVAEGRYDRALEALRKAQELDPEAPDNALNIGAVLLLQGRLPEATARFGEYLEQSGDSAEAHYLVANNYAGSGYARLAVENLRRAVELDETLRLRARTDPNFTSIADSPQFRKLLETDLHPPGSGDRVARRSFPVAYAGGDGKLLSAVLEGLRGADEPFDPRVEVTPGWALVHGELRVKVLDREDDGVVEISAPAEALPEEEWERRVDAVVEAVEIALLRRERSEGERSAPEPPLPEAPDGNS